MLIISFTSILLTSKIGYFLKLDTRSLIGGQIWNFGRVFRRWILKEPEDTPLLTLKKYRIVGHITSKNCEPFLWIKSKTSILCEASNGNLNLSCWTFKSSSIRAWPSLNPEITNEMFKSHLRLKPLKHQDFSVSSPGRTEPNLWIDIFLFLWSALFGCSNSLRNMDASTLY